MSSIAEIGEYVRYNGDVSGVTFYTRRIIEDVLIKGTYYKVIEKELNS